MLSNVIMIFSKTINLFTQHTNSTRNECNNSSIPRIKIRNFEQQFGIFWIFRNAATLRGSTRETIRTIMVVVRGSKWKKMICCFQSKYFEKSNHLFTPSCGKTEQGLRVDPIVISKIFRCLIPLEQLCLAE